MKMRVKNIQETRDNDEERQAWCLLTESENEQLQEVISRRDTQKVKKAQGSVTVECGEQSKQLEFKENSLK